MNLKSSQLERICPHCKDGQSGGTPLLPKFSCGTYYVQVWAWEKGQGKQVTMCSRSATCMNAGDRASWSHRASECMK